MLVCELIMCNLVEWFNRVFYSQCLLKIFDDVKEKKAM